MIPWGPIKIERPCNHMPNEDAHWVSASGVNNPPGGASIGQDSGHMQMPASKLPCIVETNPLLGTWKLKAYVVTTAAGERPTPYGENPAGYISYSADGRMQVIAAANDRIARKGTFPPEHERAALFDTMFAYAGTYSVDAGKVTHHVDISWNEIWTGTDQVRLFEVSGNTLTLTTRIADPVSGTETHYAVIWEKVAGPG